MVKYFWSILVIIGLVAIYQFSGEESAETAVNAALTEAESSEVSDAESAEDKKTAEVSKLLQEKFSGLDIAYIAETPIKGLYAVLPERGQLVYFSEDGKYQIDGRIIDIENRLDMTREIKEEFNALKNPLRKELIAEVAEQDMVVYAAAEEKYRVSVFTDVDCGFCRKMHQEMAGYNDLGITVQYLGFPRAGIGTASHAKLRSIWCSDDKQNAMDNAKLKLQFTADTCNDPVADHLKIVREVGITGTPAIVLSNGRLIGGFVKPNQLISILEQEQLN